MLVLVVSREQGRTKQSEDSTVNNHNILRPIPTSPPKKEMLPLPKYQRSAAPTGTDRFTTFFSTASHTWKQPSPDTSLPLLDRVQCYNLQSTITITLSNRNHSPPIYRRKKWRHSEIASLAQFS